MATYKVVITYEFTIQSKKTKDELTTSLVLNNNVPIKSEHDTKVKSYNRKIKVN